MSINLPESAKLYLCDSRGIYIPQNFIEFTYEDCIDGVSSWVKEVLAIGPEHEGYWDAWDECLSSCVVTSKDDGVKYTLWQDGDLWLIPVGAEWPEE